MKSVISFLIIATVFCSCTASQKASKNITGHWVLKSVVTDGITNAPKTNFFNEANFSCFIGSDWKFSDRVYQGSVMLVDKQKECPELTRRFKWKYTNSGTPAIFFTRLDEKGNPLNETGSQYLLTENTGSSMKLRQEISINGQSGALIYNFVRQ